MAIRFNGLDDVFNTFTLGSNMQAIVNGGANAVDRIIITKDQTALVRATADSTQLIELAAGTVINKVEMGFGGVGRLQINGGHEVSVHPSTQFKIGEGEYNLEGLIAFMQANGVNGENYTVTGNEVDQAGDVGETTATYEFNVTQNAFGYLVNTLGTGQKVTGESDVNTLKAQVINQATTPGNNDTVAVMPMLENMHNVELQALAIGDAVTVDAVHMNGTDHYASVNSRGDLNIINVRIADDQITEDITLEMRNTVANNDGTPGGVNGSDLNVWFEQSSLRSAPEETEADAQFFVQLADAQATDPNAPLANVRITDLVIDHDGNNIALQGIESEDDTYQGLVAAIQAKLDAAGYGDRYKAELGAQFTEVNGVNTQIPGFDVVIVDTKEPAVPFNEEDIQLGVGNKLGVGGSATVLGDSGVEFDDRTTEFKVTTNVILDNVGVGSEGGNVFVGSMSNSASSGGIQIFNVEVRNNSNIGEITTTTTADQTTSRFDELHITNGDGYEGNLVFRNTASIENGTTINGGDLIKAEDFAGNLTLGSVNRIENVDLIDARIEGDVHVRANYTEGSNNVISTGTGNDTINVEQTAGQSITISAQGGRNTITVDQGTANITTGSGVDIIRGNEASITVNTGNGADVIYAENTGGKAELVIDADQDFTADELKFLFGRQIQVTLSTDGNAADGFDNGFESQLIDIVSGSARLTTKADLNNAIVEAINEDSVLSKLAKASIVNGNVEIEYLIDGVQSGAAISVNFFGKEFAELSSTARNTIAREWRDEQNDSDITNTVIAAFSLMHLHKQLMKLARLLSVLVVKSL